MKFEEFTVEQLIKENIIEPPMDGNHGGIHPKGSDFIEQGIPFITAADIQNGKINFKTCKFISLERANILKKGFSKEGDVLLTHKATIGRTAVVPKMKYQFIVLSPQVTYYRVKKRDKLNAYYLKMYFDSHNFQGLFRNWAGSGSTRAYLGITAQRKLPLKLQSIRIQNKIVEIMRPIKEKLVVNERIIENLEDLTQTLFKRWFVDFEFPNENGEPYKSNGGKMVESELGMIPEGWKVEQLQYVTEIQNGYAFKSADYTENGIKVLRTLNIHSEGLLVNNDNLKYLPKSFYQSSKYSKQRLGLFDVLLVMVGATIGKQGLVLSTNLPSLQNQNMWRFRSRDNFLTNEILYFYIKEIVKSSANWKSGSAREFFRKDTFSKRMIILPSNIYLNKLKHQFRRIFKNMDNLNSQNESLKELRDTLLPKLLSGELQLPDTLEVTDDVPVS